MSGPDATRAVEKYRRKARRYNRRTRGADRFRSLAVERLALQPGETVIDVACGTGVNFALIEERIGQEGRIVGIDLSPDMLVEASKRVEADGWSNVTLVEASIEDAAIPAEADGALFSLTHDVLQSEAAVGNVVRHLRPGGRVSSFGAKWAPSWLLPVNALVWYTARKYVTTFEHFDRPWHLLERFVPDLKIRSLAFGALYLAWGAVQDSASSPSRNWSTST
jgi:ubiquinone/menaquinone biosynthesis C-methylase UbiE